MTRQGFHQVRAPASSQMSGRRENFCCSQSRQMSSTPTLRTTRASGLRPSRSFRPCLGNHLISLGSLLARPLRPLSSTGRPIPKQMCLLCREATCGLHPAVLHQTYLVHPWWGPSACKQCSDQRPTWSVWCTSRHSGSTRASPSVPCWAFAQRMGATMVEVSSGHVAMVSHPDEVVTFIEAAVKSAVPVAA